MVLGPQYYILPILGVLLLLWGLMKLFQFLREQKVDQPALRANRMSGAAQPPSRGAASPAPPAETAAPPPGAAEKPARPVKETIAIVGGIVSIVLGVVTILEKLAALASS